MFVTSYSQRAFALVIRPAVCDRASVKSNSGENVLARTQFIDRGDVSVGSAAITLLRGPRRDRSNDPVEVGLRSRIAVDRHVLGHVELQPLNVPEQRNGVRVDIRKISAGGRRAIQVRVDQNLLLREIRNQHIVAVVETIDVIKLDRLVAVADRVPVRERLQR